VAEDDVFQIDTSEVTKLAGDMVQYGLWSEGASRSRINYWSRILQKEVITNIGIRPGPMSRTGQYRASIMVSTGDIEGSPAAIVYSKAPQAHRLEYGFVGKDRLGRTYHQHPFPHFGPAIEKVTPLMQADMADDNVKWWSQ
jgi:hypothetical protein